MGARRLGREMALQMLYASDLNPTNEHYSLPREDEDSRTQYESLDFAAELVKGVTEHRAAIDELLTAKSKNWSLARMARVDLSILRLAIFELLYCRDIPKNVTINEAIEVAKKFGTEDSPSFVNGILDEIATGLTNKN
ncbi:MAG: transcription antitermination factor NusB [Deltaproteobacteria bacterium]|nr:transcription antitermination factor NusB [Deltaproteobacteria bacterium]